MSEKNTVNSADEMSVLNMLKEGRITAGEAEELLETLRLIDENDDNRDSREKPSGGRTNEDNRGPLFKSDPPNINLSALSSIGKEISNAMSGFTKNMKDIFRDFGKYGFSAFEDLPNSADGICEDVISGEDIREIRIRNFRGNIKVKGDEKEGAIKIKAELTAKAESPEAARNAVENFKLEINVDGGIAEIKPPRDKEADKALLSIDFFIEVPSRLRVLAQNGGGDFNVSHISGGLGCKLGSGDVEARDCREAINLETKRGNIELFGGNGTIRLFTRSGNVKTENAGGLISAESLSGNVEAANCRGVCELSSKSGNIKAIDCEVDRLKGSTNSGNVELKPELKDNFVIEASSLSGSLKVIVPSAVSAEIIASTMSGSVKLGDFIFAGEKSRGKVNGKIGGADNIGGSINLKTLSGDIKLSS